MLVGNVQVPTFLSLEKSSFNARVIPCDIGFVYKGKGYERLPKHG